MKKLQIIKKAFRPLKLIGASSDPSIPQYPDALIDLEAMMAELDAIPSVNTGYNSTGDNATLEEESGLTLGDLNGISAMLAVNIGADYTIEVPKSTHMQARAGLSGLIKRGAVIPSVKYTGRIPRGLGNLNNNCNRYLNNFYRDITASSNANHFKVNSFIDWPVDFTSWLLGDTLTAVTWVSQNSKIKIENESFTNQIATAKLTFNNVGVYTVQITGTSASGQVVVDVDFAISDKLEQ
jgi:hypothetical protein